MSATRRKLISRQTLWGIERRLARRLYGRAPERDQWLRQTMYEHVDAFFAALPPDQNDAVEVSGTFYDNHPWRSYEQRHFPEFDLCNPSPITRRFDVVICDQVLEHVVDPNRAVATLADLCTPGGYVVVGVPFLVRVHPAPDDYWRFTADGLRVLLERAGLEVVELRSWGNRHCVNANFFAWAKKPAWASNANEPDFPVTVWAIARRPGIGSGPPAES